eukprot:4216388-Pleurochrysis_carterae.AAC.1
MPQLRSRAEPEGVRPVPARWRRNVAKYNAATGDVHGGPDRSGALSGGCVDGRELGRLRRQKWRGVVATARRPCPSVAVSARARRPRGDARGLGHLRAVRAGSTDAQ